MTQIRQFWYRTTFGYRHSCHKCGFLALAKGEAPADVRRVIAADGKAGWSATLNTVDCHRHLWTWLPQEAEVGIITYETNRPRYWCQGFIRYSPGRTPAEHLVLEDERRGFRHQRRLAWLAFFGALLGAALGAFGTVWFGGG